MRFNKQIFTILILSLSLALLGSGCISEGEGAEGNATQGITESEFSNIRENPVTPWNPVPTAPDIDPTAYIDPQASVIGNVTIGASIMVSPMASIRSDEGMPIFVGSRSNVQDGVVLHALETIDEEGEPVEKNTVEVAGEKYAVYIGENVSLAHQSQVHGPASVGNDTFIGMQAFVFKSKIGNNCVLEPTAAAIGVTVPDGRYIPAGVVVTSQEEADKLPEITEDYAYKHTNEAVVYVNVHLAEGYNKAS
ncbi:carbonic anhydrase [Methanosarcina sp. A14]|uniref:Carbonic anhydrase n=2 Tax=Methanosarcina barkeri TaxID=2208 RepID=A0A0E3QU57_METBA|nr:MULTISPECIES: carbonic anhydrase [Methanosarcina]AKB54180.1 Carbonic anhydrase [Methanosarcina barkeri MS]AKJ38286.1 carbonic anhydrase [Methanosarcina barkeri CM1]OED07963.1 carbonic anhydrase [Methanosarcina sp. A14]